MGDYQPRLRRDWISRIMTLAATVVFVGTIFGFCYSVATHRPEECWHGRTMQSFAECRNAD